MQTPQTDLTAMLQHTAALKQSQRLGIGPEQLEMPIRYAEFRIGVLSIPCGWRVLRVDLSVGAFSRGRWTRRNSFCTATDGTRLHAGGVIGLTIRARQAVKHPRALNRSPHCDTILHFSLLAGHHPR